MPGIMPLSPCEAEFPLRNSIKAEGGYSRLRSGERSAQRRVRGPVRRAAGCGRDPRHARLPLMARGAACAAEKRPSNPIRVMPAEGMAVSAEVRPESS